MTFSILNKLAVIPAILCLVISVFLAARPSLAATDFDFFGTDIDYWHDSKAKHKSAVEKKDQLALPSETKTNHDSAPESADRFSWTKVLDPKNKEFFKEGDYTPPEAFMEIVRNPTDANLKLWFAYNEKKNQLSDRLQARMKEYMEKNTVKLNDTGRAYLESKASALPKSEPDAKRFRFRMYFDSHCPHCHRMFGTLSELQAKGFYVEARQVDSDSRGLEGLSVPAQRASPGEIKEKDIKSVPLLLVGDLEKKAVYRLTGFQTLASIFKAINDHGGTQ